MGRLAVLSTVLAFGTFVAAAHGATFTVTNTNNGGVGSLRAAIASANATAAADTISFSVTGTIKLTTAPLPAIVHPLVIDGRTAPGFAGSPLVRIDNGTGNASAIGLDITAGSSEVRALSITRFGTGIQLETGGADTVAGNWIGLMTNGAANANGTGVAILGSSTGNTVGGTTAASRNVISGNTNDGVDVSGSGTTGNVVAGNSIGTNVAGTAAVANGGDGVAIFGAAATNTVGGTATGSANILSGNTFSGVAVSGAGTSGNLVQGNLVGTNRVGTAAIPNAARGVEIFGGATQNTVGGTTAAARNVLSGNTFEGVAIYDAATTLNLVEGNYIGTKVTGTSALANDAAGIIVFGGAHANTIGGVNATARNVISGNAFDGITIVDSGSSSNVVEANYIGTDRSGTASVPNGGNGIVVASGAASNTVGGTTMGKRNLISGNTTDGVSIRDAGTTGTIVEGNYIGTTVTGAAALANGNDGVSIRNGAATNTVGGASASTRNLISGNSVDGVALSDSGTSANVVSSNYIGTDPAGTAAVANGFNGVHISSQASDNVVGGTTSGRLNLISGNVTAGVAMDFSGCAIRGPSNGSGTTGNIVEGNYIGTEVTGTSALPNGTGVLIDNGANVNTVGGTTPNKRNLISGNTVDGVSITECGTDGNIVEGNYIGTEVTGTSAVANGSSGVSISTGAASNVVGGTVAGARNVISGNGLGGVTVRDSALSNRVQGNYIGTELTGTAALANGGNGVAIFGGASSTTVGGAVPAARNVISGNTQGGVAISQTGTSSNLVQGNYIGTDVTGSAALGNAAAGVVMQLGASNNTIGGTTAGKANVISGNGQGVVLTNNGGTAADPTVGNVVEGNLIGTDKTGASAIPNTSNGVNIENGPRQNTIGGTSAAARNVIAFNGGQGVRVDATNFPTNGDEIVGNSIFSNGGLGILLVNGGNDLQPAPVITSVTTVGGTTTVHGTLSGSAASTHFRIEVFVSASCDPSGGGEGRQFLGQTTIVTNGSGSGSFAFGTPALASGKAVTATATNVANHDTSQFSVCATS